MKVTRRESTEAPSSHYADDGRLRLLLVASEIYPLTKTGGLADVCASLPQRLAELDIDVRLMMPGYPQALERVRGTQTVTELGEVLPGHPVRLVRGLTPDTGLPIWLLDCPTLYQRSGGPYQDEQGRDWPDNAVRFGMLGHVAARIAGGQAEPGWKPDIVHAHDWHTGLVPLLVRRLGATAPRTVFTIHNMAFQGLFPQDYAAQLGLPDDICSVDGAEFYGRLSYLKAGIRYADKITTVSPTYAREIRTPEFGFGMEGLLEHRSADLIGIMNGIDAGLWNPADDPSLAQCYDIEHMQGKAVCKSDLQRQFGLHADAEAPLAVSISRLTHQKMADVLLERLPSTLARHPRLQVVVHGCGEQTLERGFAALATHFPGRLSVDIGYQEALAHRMHAGGDILLHGSRFEPCGLAQLYAMRYGTIPIVRRVGGLAGSVIDAGDAAHHVVGSTGFVFEASSGEAMEGAVDRCLETYASRPQAWADMRRQGMSGDFGWARSAQGYAHLYADLVPEYTPPDQSQKRAGDARGEARHTSKSDTRRPVTHAHRRTAAMYRSG